jgi:hypothetical protein
MSKSLPPEAVDSCTELRNPPVTRATTSSTGVLSLNYISSRYTTLVPNSVLMLLNKEFGAEPKPMFLLQDYPQKITFINCSLILFLCRTYSSHIDSV